MSAPWIVGTAAGIVLGVVALVVKTRAEERTMSKLYQESPYRLWTCPECGMRLYGPGTEGCTGYVDIADPEQGETEDRDYSHPLVLRSNVRSTTEE